MIGERKPRHYRWATLAVVVILIIGAVVVWDFFFRFTLPSVEPASVDRMAFPLPKEPSIAVMPFENLSGDPNQEYFSDGITEEIITSISKIPGVFVIARQSTFVYKGKAVKVQKVAEDLGVRYILVGSVRKAGARIRITAQFIDAITGRHLWAERYDSDFSDIFKIQEEITIKIMEAIQVKLFWGEAGWGSSKGVQNIKAYETMLQGAAYLNHFNKEGNALARKKFEDAIKLDPDWAGGYSFLAWAYWYDAYYGWSTSPIKSMEKALELSKQALNLDENNTRMHALLGFMYTFRKEWGKAHDHFEKAMALDPNDPLVLHQFSIYLQCAGDRNEAIAILKKARRVNPFDKKNVGVSNMLGNVYHMLGLYDEALIEYKKAIKIQQNHLGALMGLAATSAMMGSEEEAKKYAADVMRLNPKFTLENYSKTLPFKNAADIEMWINALRKAGLK